MLRSSASPVLLSAVTVMGKTPLEIVNDPEFNFGVNVHTAPIAQVWVGVTMAVPELLTIVTCGLATVIVMLVYVAESITADDRNPVSVTSCARSTVTGFGNSATLPGCSTALVIWIWHERTVRAGDGVSCTTRITVA